jgi:hypothetical protein
MGDGTISGRYGNGPTTVLDHFGMEFRFLVHPENTRLQQNGSISNSAATIKLSITGGPIAGAGGTHRCGSGLRAVPWCRPIGASAQGACLANNKGHDDCSSEFRKLKNAQSDFESDVSEYESECN